MLGSPELGKLHFEVGSTVIAAAKCNNGCIHSILLIEGRILKERGHGRESKGTQIEDAKTTDGGCVVSTKKVSTQRGGVDNDWLIPAINFPICPSVSARVI